MRRFAMVFVSICVLLAAGCATGPNYAELSANFPRIEAGKGRVFFYRPSSPIGWALAPDIVVNGEVVGGSVPGGFFYRDFAPGDYEVSTSTEVKRTATFRLAAAETSYVKFTVGFGLVVGRVHPSLVPPSDGEREIRTLSYSIGAE